MSCNCKKNRLGRAKVIQYNRSWNDLDVVEQGQISALYNEEFNKWGTDEEVINWLNS